MSVTKQKSARRGSLAFILVFGLSLALGALSSLARPTEVAASPASARAVLAQAPGYAGSESCRECHENIINVWSGTRHSQAFSSPIFQRDWAAEGSNVTCLECHTTGYDPATGKYTEAGVGCESCHGPFQPGHPQQPMSVTPTAELCARCHKQTTDEWRASVHSSAGIVCEDCHNPHSQTPKAETITALCSNCHKERGDSFTHGTHASAGLECSNCHMYTSPRTSSPIQGLVPTGHTFSVGSEACVGCHQDTVHTRDEIIKLSGEVQELSQVDTASLQQKLDVQEQEITKLEAQSSVRLYTGLTQGAIIGLLTGGAAAWVVSRGIRVVQVEDDEEQKDQN
jgi:nitrate/TMAO reductase-like tetraheme cytochrome c subunit